ncbi:hypothetical protein IR083_07755 [Dysgonomonas sp. GY75]|uniref:hypothetical protein n=1 Tax=Dysgonomonas sp. GY75 TaxID=2780419 RepID=UPI00188397B8|nr:hypothetical protein [Dysgonomonas sp. GY75]MBF0648712.1 hypothetical protein [Dysgonomonas sp. GY75]
MQVPFNYIDPLDIPEELAEWVDHPGDCEKDLVKMMQLEEIQTELNKIDPENLRQELKEYGAWTEEELNNHNDNLIRILWIACCNINEGNV